MTTTAVTLKITSPPKIGDFSDADFLNQIFKYEKQFGKQIVPNLPKMLTATL